MPRRLRYDKGFLVAYQVISRTLEETANKTMASSQGSFGTISVAMDASEYAGTTPLTITSSDTSLPPPSAYTHPVPVVVASDLSVLDESENRNVNEYIYI